MVQARFPKTREFYGDTDERIWPAGRGKKYASRINIFETVKPAITYRSLSVVSLHFGRKLVSIRVAGTDP